MPLSFAERLDRGVIICDGAMGTNLYDHNVARDEKSLEMLNLSAPDIVKTVHLDYIRAGAELIQANSFGANRSRMAVLGLEAHVEEVNRAALIIAKSARTLTGQDIWIAGSIGPLGADVLSFGALDSASGHNIFAEQAAILADEGADVLILETFTSLSEIQLALRAVRSVSSLPIIASMSFTEDGVTVGGDTPEHIAKALNSLDIVAIGGNCSVGPEVILQVVERMATITTKPIVAQPNAGYPTYHDGKLVYVADPDYVAGRARKMVESGASLLGGCCGTTPAHVSAIRDAVRGVLPGRIHARQLSPESDPPQSGGIYSKPTATQLAQRLNRKEFIITVEVDPPRGFDISPTLDRLRGIVGVVHALNVADSPRAQGRMSALSACSLLQSRLGVETIMHMALRHRNLLALHSDLLGAHALGVRNMFAIMGDAPLVGDYPQATAVRDITTTGLIKLIASFNKGVDASDRSIGNPTSFFVGCALNFSAVDMDKELRVLDRKLNAGANFILTQPVYDPERVEQISMLLGGFPVPVLLGILPLRSLRHAQFLHHEVPGITVPENIFERLERAGEDSANEGIAISKELLVGLHHLIGGAYFIPPFGRYQVVTEILSGLDIPGI
jgi:methionine synthase I (cobalamin-dependent)/5,10-methylenetetrahydrofolate reductase